MIRLHLCLIYLMFHKNESRFFITQIYSNQYSHQSFCIDMSLRVKMTDKTLSSGSLKSTDELDVKSNSISNPKGVTPLTTPNSISANSSSTHPITTDEMMKQFFILKRDVDSMKQELEMTKKKVEELEEQL